MRDECEILIRDMFGMIIPKSQIVCYWTAHTLNGASLTVRNISTDRERCVYSTRIHTKTFFHTLIKYMWNDFYISLTLVKVNSYHL